MPNYYPKQKNPTLSRIPDQMPDYQQEEFNSMRQVVDTITAVTNN